jgi:hypothetical protein
MANKPIAMLKLRQVLRYFTEGTSKKQISIITGVARNMENPRIMIPLRQAKMTPLRQIKMTPLRHLILTPNKLNRN